MKGPNLVSPELKSLEPAIAGFQVLTYNYNCLRLLVCKAPKPESVLTNALDTIMGPMLYPLLQLPPHVGRPQTSPGAGHVPRVFSITIHLF